MKLGKEVEGEYQGQVTVFIGVNELSTLLNILDPNVNSIRLTAESMRRRTRLRATELEHIYISDLENLLSYSDFRLARLSQLGYEITLEVSKVSAGKPDFLNLMYHILDIDIWHNLNRMSGIDQIKFSNGLNVLATPKKHFHRTLPEAFQADEEI